MHMTEVETHKARKAHRCKWCWQRIDEGTEYKRYRYYDGGKAATIKMHPECMDAMQEEAAHWGGDFEWTPGQERPKVDANVRTLWRYQMDAELEELAALALRNAFWHDFSALVNEYLEAAKGLDTDTQEMQMGEMTSIYGRDTDAEGDVPLNIWTQNGESKFATTGHETMIESLEHEPATEVHLRGKKVFERRDGEWHFTGG